MRCEACGGQGSVYSLDREVELDEPCGVCGGSGFLELEPPPSPDFEPLQVREIPTCEDCGACPSQVTVFKTNPPGHFCRACNETRKENEK